MTDYNGANTGAVSRLGQVNGANDAKALFLKVFAGEVLTAFNTNNIGMGLHRVRSISSGKSAQFPLTGLSTTATLVAGDEIVPTAINHNEKVITINDLLTSSAFIARIDEAMNHYDVRSIYSSEIGNALAKAADVNIFKSIANASVGKDNAGAALPQADSTPTSGGTILSGEAVATISGQEGADLVFDALQTLDSKNITGEKYVVLTPALYYAMFKGSTNNMAGFMSSDFGSGGNANAGTVPMIGGAKVFMSNNLPAEAGYSVGGSAAGAQDIQALVFTKDAAATVKLLDLGVESEYLIQNQGTLMVAKYAMGHDALRGECAVRIVQSVS
tara:strand:+ start:17071 stop:18060 length:990 start_codon:yes stop_codon:yes gene_type:complete